MKQARKTIIAIAKKWIHRERNFLTVHMCVFEGEKSTPLRDTIFYRSDYVCCFWVITESAIYLQRNPHNAIKVPCVPLYCVIIALLNKHLLCIAARRTKSKPTLAQAEETNKKLIDAQKTPNCGSIFSHTYTHKYFSLAVSFEQKITRGGSSP